MNRSVIVPLGGFLGCGKTTLILAAARILGERGLRAAAILNDQGAELVDTSFVRASGVAADQVTGGVSAAVSRSLLNRQNDCASPLATVAFRPAAARASITGSFQPVHSS